MEDSKKTEQTRSGFVTLIGRPNVGKSTLMNHLIGQKIAITSKKPQTTRNRIRTVYTDERGQIVFLDTPGMHKVKNKLGTYMEDVVLKTIKEVDLILWLVEPTTYVGAGEQEIVKLLKQLKVPVLLVINKTDTIQKEEITKVLETYNSLMNYAGVVCVSALKDKGVDDVLFLTADLADVAREPCQAAGLLTVLLLGKKVSVKVVGVEYRKFSDAVFCHDYPFLLCESVCNVRLPFRPYDLAVADQLVQVRHALARGEPHLGGREVSVFIEVYAPAHAARYLVGVKPGLIRQYAHYLLHPVLMVKEYPVYALHRCKALGDVVGRLGKVLRELYSSDGIYKVRMYDGVEKMLDSLN